MRITFDYRARSVSLIVIHSGDAVLYTTTVNTVFRVYSPVLDDPTWFQLLSSIDHRALRPNPASGPSHQKGKGREEDNQFGKIWPLDAEVLRAALLEELGEVNDGKVKPSAMVRKVLEGLATDESDVLLYTDGRGLLSLRSIVVSLHSGRLAIPGSVADVVEPRS